jgi:hypothetical protein
VSAIDPLIEASISPVACSRASASSRSRLSSATSVSFPAAVNLPRFAAFVFRRRALTRLPPVLLRRLIAFSEAQTNHRIG